MILTQKELAVLLRTHEGGEVKSDGVAMDLRRGLARAADVTVPDRSPDKVMKAAALLERISTDGDLRLEAEDIVELKKLAVPCFPPSVYRQIHEALEPPSKPKLHELPKDAEMLKEGL